MVAPRGTNPTPAALLEAFRSCPTSGKSLFLQEVSIDDTTSLPAKTALFEAALKEDAPQIASGRAELLADIASRDADYAIQTLGQLYSTVLLGDVLGLSDDAVLDELRPHATKFLQAATGWLDRPNFKVLLQVAKGLERVYAGQEALLLEGSREWPERSGAHRAAHLTILHDLLSHTLKTPQDPTGELARRFVLDRAKVEGVDTTAIIKTEKDPHRQALLVVDHLRSPPQPIDWNQLSSNLSKVPSIAGFLGRPLQRLIQQRADHPLLRLLAQRPPTPGEIGAAERRLRDAKTLDERASAVFVAVKLRERAAWLSYWDDVFSRLGKSIPGTEGLRSKLVNADETFDALCEAEIISRLARTLNVDANIAKTDAAGPRDARVHTPHELLVLEIYNPKPEWELMYTTGSRGADRDHFLRQVLGKFKKQLRHLQPKEPLILVVHAGQSPLGEWDVERVLVGQQAISITYDTNSGQAVEEHPTNLPDGLAQKDPATAMISGILLYRRDLAATPPTLDVNFTPNPNGARPVSPRDLKAMLQGLQASGSASSAGSQGNGA